jgi:hypothetical protein
MVRRLLTHISGVSSSPASTFSISVLNWPLVVSDLVEAVRSCKDNPVAAKCSFASATETLAVGSWLAGAGKLASTRPIYVVVTGPPEQDMTVWAF